MRHLPLAFVVALAGCGGSEIPKLTAERDAAIVDAKAARQEAADAKLVAQAGAAALRESETARQAAEAKLKALELAELSRLKAEQEADKAEADSARRAQEARAALVNDSAAERIRLVREAYAKLTAKEREKVDSIKQRLADGVFPDTPIDREFMMKCDPALTILAEPYLDLGMKTIAKRHADLVAIEDFCDWTDGICLAFCLESKTSQDRILKDARILMKGPPFTDRFLKSARDSLYLARGLENANARK